MRVLLSVGILPNLSEESIISLAALVLLFLSIGLIIWPKFTSLIAMIWGDVKAAVKEV